MSLTRNNRTVQGIGLNNRADVAIGGEDAYGDSIGPQLHATRFGGRVGMTLDAADVEPDSGDESLVGGVLEKVMVRSDGNGSRSELHRWYEHGDGLEWEIVWDRFADLPRNGTVRFGIDCPVGLQWYKQPAPTQQEIDDGVIQPDNVRDSQAIYWPNSGKIMRGERELVNWETGKWGHLYFPYVIGSEGTRLRCLSMEKVGNQIVIQLPVDAMRAAGDDRWTLDPTWGYETAGSSSDSNTFNWGNVNPTYFHTTTASEQITEFHIYAEDGSTAMAAYTTNVTPLPVTRLGSPVTITLTATAGWRSTSGLSIAMADATEYTLCNGSASTSRRYYDISSNASCSDFTVGALPATWSNNNFQSRLWSQFATFEIAATGRIPYELYYD